MTKNQLIANIIFFIPLVIANFFTYGFNGVAGFVKEVNKYLTGKATFL